MSPFSLQQAGCQHNLVNHLSLFESRFKSLVGRAFKLKQVAQSLGYQRTPGIRSSLFHPYRHPAEETAGLIAVVNRLILKITLRSG